MILGFSKKFPWGEPTDFERKILDGEKIHTIREDPNHRWKLNMPIQFATGVRTKRYNCFKVGRCLGLQRIAIDPDTKLIWVDGKRLSTDQAYKLMIRDGFKNHFEFWRWFNKPFKGVLIHWTNDNEY